MAYSYVQGAYSAGWYPTDSQVQRKIGSRLYYQITDTATTYRIDVYGQCSVYKDKLTMDVGGKLNLTGKSQVTGSRHYSYSAVSSNSTDRWYTICSVTSNTWPKTTSTRTVSASMKAYRSTDESGYYSTASKTFTVPALAKYTIYFNANGGSGNTGSQTKWYGQAITLNAAPTRPGYTFAGWKWKNTGDAISAGSPWNGANESNTFYAQWTPNKYTIHYNATTGTGTMDDSVDIDYDTDFTLPTNTFTKEDNIFAGWAREENGVALYDNGTADSKIVRNLATSGTANLYATWQTKYTQPDIQRVNGWRRGESMSGSMVDDDTGNYARLVAEVVPALQREVLNGEFSYITTQVSAGIKAINDSTYYMHPTVYSITSPVVKPNQLVWDFDNQTLSGESNFTPLDIETQYDLIFIAVGIVDGVEKIRNSLAYFISTAEFALDINADGSSFGLFSIAPGTYVEEVDETDSQTTANRVKTVSINGDLLLTIDEHAGEGHIDDTLLKLLRGLSWNVTVNPQDVVQTSSETESGTETNTDTNSGE